MQTASSTLRDPTRSPQFSFLPAKMVYKMASNSRKTSIVEAAEQHFDKNTVILIVNLVILTVLMGLLYMVATSAMAAGGKDEN